MVIRPVCASDSRILWLWRNDSETRAMFRQSDETSWDDHSKWFSRALHEPDTFIVIGENDRRESIGVARFERDQERRARISITIAPEWRGRGYGKALLISSTDAAARHFEIRRFIAIVKPKNMVSRALFLSAGFVPQIVGLEDDSLLRYEKDVR